MECGASRFSEIEAFRTYILSTKDSYVRTVFFMVDFTAGTIDVVRSFRRSATTDGDVDSIVSTVRSAHGNPIWFVVRSDFNDHSDSDFRLGYCDPHLPLQPFVGQFTARLFPAINVHHYRTIRHLEDGIWSHIFPLYASGLDDSPLAIEVVVVDNPHSRDPCFKLVKQVSQTMLSHFCKNKQSLYVLLPNPDTGRVAVSLLHPEGVCILCGSTPVDSYQEPHLDKTKTVYAFMKADLLAWLASHADGRQYAFTSDSNSCADFRAPARKLEPVPRRRSNEDVLSPPTLDKYNKGSSKRTRNFPDQEVELFQANSAG